MGTREPAVRCHRPPADAAGDAAILTLLPGAEIPFYLPRHRRVVAAAPYPAGELKQRTLEK
jgi:hypothetical protein